MALSDTGNGLWFQEDLYSDIAYGFRVSAVLLRETTAWQDILVLETPALGKVLVLDGIVQCAQKDEAIYHEMLAHGGVFLRLATAPVAAGLRVLVVGGGDGGIARECLKHGNVSELTVVDIDPRVRETTLAFFPELSAGAYSDSRLSAVDVDAAGFVRQHQDRFDLIVVDTTDPIGASVPLFGREFVADCHKALKEGGVLVRQAGSLILQTEEFVGAHCDISAVFGSECARAGVLANCSYLGGWFAAVTAVKNVRYPDREPLCQAIQAQFERAALNVLWYSPEMHRAALTLPPFAARLIEISGNQDY